MKRILLSFMVILALSFASGARAAPGDSPDNPIFISTPEQLDAVRNGLDKYYKLSNDIDLTAYLAPGGAGYAKWGAAGWAPIGTYVPDAPFSGGLDGYGNKITGIWIDRSDAECVGLFGYSVNADIGNLGVEIGAAGIKGDYNIGGVAGSQSGSSITNCYTTGNVSGNNQVGGLVGYQYNSSLENCYTTGNVSGDYQIGGLVGSLYDGNIENCYATGNVSGTNNIGGLVGSQNSSSIINCYTTSNVSGISTVGGLVGFQCYDGSIENCYATGYVSGNSEVGGLVGYSFLSSIENCYATGSVSGASAIGGLAGYQELDGSITNCYATGEVSGDEYVGGLVGYQYNSSIENCYATSNVSGDLYVGGLVGVQNADTGRNNTITNCYATGNASGNSGVGGLAGYQYNSSIENCYVTSNVSGDLYVGGLVGVQNADTGRDNAIINSYATGNISGNNQVGGLAGYQIVGSITNSYRYQFTTVNGTAIPASDPDSAPNRRHGGIATSNDLMTKATYTDNSWLFNDSSPVAGPWRWDSKNFPKLNMGTESFPFPWDPLIPSTPVITINAQPAANTTVMAGAISGDLSVDASIARGGILSYQWYSNTSNSSAGGTLITGATSSVFPIPTDLMAGTYYYYCVVSALDTESVASNVARVTVQGGRESRGGKGGGCNAMGYGGYLAFALFGTAPLVLGKRR